MTTAVVYGDTLDVASTPKITMTTLVKVEMRKMVDTRAGKWLLIAIVFLTIAVPVIFLLAAHQQDHTFVNAMVATGTPQGILLPVLGILLVTQEWGQRTGMVTFTLVPHRDKVLWAKVIAAVLFGLLAVVIAMVVGVVVVAIGGATAPYDGVTLAVVLGYPLLQVLGVVGGLVFGLIFLNSAGAIVASFAIPIAFSILTSLWTALHKAQPWIDPGTSQGPLQQGQHLSGEDWNHLLVTSLIWVVVPFVIGMWRVLRAEVK